MCWSEASALGRAPAAWGRVRHAKASVFRIERAVDEGWARRWVSGLNTENLGLGPSLKPGPAFAKSWVQPQRAARTLSPNRKTREHLKLVKPQTGLGGSEHCDSSLDANNVPLDAHCMAVHVTECGTETSDVASWLR